jgi:hypothetical protein
MISVILVARDDEERLLRSLAALVPLAAEGVVADVIVADLGSRDATFAIAEAAGCTIIEACADIGTAIGRAAEAARKDWLLALLPGDVPDHEVAIAAKRHVAQMGRIDARPAALLALPQLGDSAHRALLSVAFDAFGYSAPHRRRILAPRAEARRLFDPARLWRGARLKARIVRRGEPS